VDPRTLPVMSQVTSEDIGSAIEVTRAAAKIVNNEKYLKWMEHYGST